MHDAIIQIRTEREITENEIKTLHNIIERYRGRSECHLYDTRNGFDIYISSVNTARHIASKILRVLGGTKKESAKHLRVENGRAIYRFTLRIKLPETPSKARYGF
jgi:NMD protein affecting ribosome stability and mRNA decay